MQNEKFQINLAEGQNKAEIVVRETDHVNELPVKPPVKIAIGGVINAPVEFLKQRIGDLDQHKCHVLVAREDLSITLTLNEDDEYQQGWIEGKMELHPMFVAFGINSGKKWTPNELGQFFKMNRAFFVDKNRNMELVSALKNFIAKVESTVQKQKEDNGNFADNYSGIVTSQLPGPFILNIPIFKGEKPEQIEVEFSFTIDGRAVSLQLYSPGANELVEMLRDQRIDEVIEKIQQLGPEIVIIEQ